MKKQIQKNIRQRQVFQQQEKQRLIFKAITQNLALDTHIRWKTQRKFLQGTPTGSVTRIKNRCILTGRARSVYRFFKISRIQLRQLASGGFLPGVSKYSW